MRDALAAVREALRITDKVDQAVDRLEQNVRVLADHERRLTRLEAQWDTAIQFSQIARGRQLPEG